MMNNNKSHLFQPGVSGNPSGRPKSDATIRDLARQQTEPAIQTLTDIMDNKKAPYSARVHAACALLDRGWGKPAQYTESVNVGMSFQDYLDNLPPPPSDAVVEARTKALLELNPEDTSQAQHIKVRRLQRQLEAEDL
jgi:hypothetical protein